MRESRSADSEHKKQRTYRENCTTVISFFYIMRFSHKPLCPKAFRVLQTKKFTAKKQKICGKNKKNYSEKAKNLQRKTVESVVV